MSFPADSSRDLLPVGASAAAAPLETFRTFSDGILRPAALFSDVRRGSELLRVRGGGAMTAEGGEGGTGV